MSAQGIGKYVYVSSYIYIYIYIKIAHYLMS